MTKNSHAIAALHGVIADGTRLAAALARQAEAESRAPVAYRLTPLAEAALTAPGEPAAGPRQRRR